jgi:hypothetical protein
MYIGRLILQVIMLWDCDNSYPLLRMSNSCSNVLLNYRLIASSCSLYKLYLVLMIGTKQFANMLIVNQIIAIERYVDLISCISQLIF